MEFLRFGSSIPGSYWGCCAVCIIQDFKQSPDDKASIQLVGGDGGNPIIRGGEIAFAGPTWKDIFLQRLRYGTFSESDMPNHTFLAVLTSEQISSGYGREWLAILKEQGFEFIRSVDNSVYTGEKVMSPGEVFSEGEEDEYWEDDEGEEGVSSHPNYIFGLFRNIGKGSITNPFLPPKAWTDLPKVTAEVYDYLGYTKDDRLNNSQELSDSLRETQLPLYEALPKGVFYTEKQLEEMDVPIHYAGKRSRYPQQPKKTRQILEEAETKNPKAGKTTLAPWG